MEKIVNTKFYEYDQNNSGGSFHNSEKEGIAEYVIIEALNAAHANARAEEIGLYFNGCDAGKDCSCCGDRWYRVYENYGSETIEESLYRTNCFVHYLDGSFSKL
jgi:hypothetical protein